MNTISDWSDQLWQNPPSIFRGAPFWSWNEKLAPERLCRQIQDMHRAGMGGFFMHSRYGLKTAYLSEDWFQCVEACIEQARKLDMKAYLYDEDRWPSGAAGGIVTRQNPEMGVHLLAAIEGDKLPAGAERLGAFAVKLNADKQMLSYRPIEDGAVRTDETLVWFVCRVSEPSPWFNEGAYLDTMNPRAVGEFVRVTHQAYADRFGKDFAGVVPAIFTDEPNFGHGHFPAEGLILQRPWTPELPLEFKKRRGYDLRDHLPELVFVQAGKPFSAARLDYHRTITELFVAAFSEQIGQWCEKNNIAATGHYLSEESLFSQTHVVGAAMPHYEFQQWPGIDILCDQIREIGTAKQCTSVAAQLDRPRVLSELYGCTGWDWPLEGHKFNAGWQYVLGVNLRCPHLSWYSMAGGAKRDYPASIFPHSPWWKHYRIVEDYFGRLSLMLTQGRPVRDVLVIHPIESAWGVYVPKTGGAAIAHVQEAFDRLQKLLLEQHYDYDLGDESILARHARVQTGKLRVGKMDYSLVVVPPCMTLRASTVSLLRRLVRGGGRVLFVGRVPDMIDGRASDQLAALTDQAMRCGAENDVVSASLEDLLARRVSVKSVAGGVAPVRAAGMIDAGGTPATPEAGFVWTMLRQIKPAQTGGKLAGQLLFLQSVDRAAGHTVRVSVAGRRPVVLWDAQTGLRRRIEAHVVGQKVEFDLTLPPTGSALVSLGMRVPEALPAEKPSRVWATHECPGPWKIELAEPNSFPLDYCDVRVAGGPELTRVPANNPDQLMAGVPVLAAEKRIRQHFGLPERANSGCQPWYLAQTGRADRTPRGQCSLRFAFHVTDVPASLKVAIERPEDFRIVLNGREIPNAADGAWVDEDIKTVNLTAANGPFGGVQAGGNVLELHFDYRSDMELEDLHLIGQFGVRQMGPGRQPGDFTLVAPTAELRPGSWVGQGLDFYGGSVRYEVPLPAEVWPAVSAGRKVRLTLPRVKCTAASISVGDKTFVLPWPPMSADITAALLEPNNASCDRVTVEVIGGRHNIFGPLHVPWRAWTGPGEFSPEDKQWTDSYLLNDMGLMQPPVVEIVE